MDSLPLPLDIVGTTRKLPEANGREPAHKFDRESVLAVNTALACGRPLLVRGEPGTGKSQLALAVAKVLERVLKSRVVDARTEPHELMWSYDAVGRLADAQAYGALCSLPEVTALRPDIERYIRPGPLWWAFDWGSAQRQENIVQRSARASTPNGEPEQPELEPNPDQTWTEGTSPDNGVVLLIDEIDKADMAVPNALLESLGSGQFDPPGSERITKNKDSPEPLILLTTNTDRVLPDAFVRRCVVLHMRVPKEREELILWLVERGEQHFAQMDSARQLEAAAKVADDRLALSGRIHSPPGLAEYIDLLAALHRNPQLDLHQIARFVLAKHQDPGKPNYVK